MHKNNINAIEEKLFIEEYLRHLKAKGQSVSLEEHPITSITQNQLSRNDCMPDALLNAGWIEITTFCRSMSMRIQIGEQRTHQEKFKDQEFIAGVPVAEFQLLDQNFLFAVNKKISKDYSAFTRLARTTPFGTLLVMFVSNDPFFNNIECEDLISKIQDQHMYDWMDFTDCCFDTIVLGAYDSDWKYAFYTILDKADIEKIKSRRLIKARILKEIEDRNLESI